MTDMTFSCIKVTKFEMLTFCSVIEIYTWQCLVRILCWFCVLVSLTSYMDLLLITLNLATPV